MFTLHLATLPRTSLAHEFYTGQVEHNVPSVVTDCLQILREHNITNIENYTKYQFKKIVRNIVSLRNHSQMLTWATSYKKVDIEKLRNEKFEVKDYLKNLNVSDS